MDDYREHLAELVGLITDEDIDETEETTREVTFSMVDVTGSLGVWGVSK